MTVPAFHTLWTAPSAARNGIDAPYRPAAWEIVTQLLSVRSWREFQGPVRLHTDTRGAAALDAVGLLGLYDDVSTGLDVIDERRIDPLVYFTGGKQVALASEKAPVAMVDTDLYLHAPVDTGAAGFVFAHWELTNGDFYPPPHRLPGTARVLEPGAEVPDRACNTAIAVFNDDSHRAAFVAASMRFMDRNADTTGLHPFAYPAFCEQRIVLVEALRRNITVAPVAEQVWNPEEERWQTQATPAAPFHHTWYMKKFLRADRRLHTRYVVTLLLEVEQRYPDDIALLERVQAVAPYIAALRARRAQSNHAR